MGEEAHDRERAGEDGDEKAIQAVAGIYLWLDRCPRLLLRWRMYGREILDEAVTNYIEKRLVPMFDDPVKPQRFELKRTARLLVESYIEARKGKYPVSERIWGFVGKVMGWPKELPLGTKIFR